MRNEILHIMPLRLRKTFETELCRHSDLEEIRIRIGQPVELRCRRESFFLKERMNSQDFEEMLTFISQYSIYAYEEEIRQGFVTIEGGHRIGFAGQVRVEDGVIRHIVNIRFLNIRIAREKKDCAREMISWLYDGDEVLNTLLISQPGIGKTTYLRDCIRMLSNGEGGRVGRKVCVIDERSEIAACHMGIPQNDMGVRTDVLDGCPKKNGMLMALRSMSPEVLAVDELGGEEDAHAVEQVLLAGCRVVGTVHGNNMHYLIQQEVIHKMHQKKLFQRYILLEKKEDGERQFQVYDEELERLC